jgi:hypothetical protein
MAKLIGGTMLAAVPAVSLYQGLVDAGRIDESRDDPMFVRNLTIRNATGADLYIGGEDLDQAGDLTTVMLTLVDGASLAEILQVYHVNLKDVFVEGTEGPVEVLGLQ